MKISEAGVHNRSLLCRFLLEGKNADITPMTKPKGENATVKQALYYAKRRPPVSSKSRVQKYFWKPQLKQGDLPPPPLARPPN